MNFYKLGKVIYIFNSTPTLESTCVKLTQLISCKVKKKLRSGNIEKQIIPLWIVWPMGNELFNNYKHANKRLITAKLHEHSMYF